MELEGQALGSEAHPWAWLVPDSSGSQSGLALLMAPRGMSPLYLLGQGGLGSPWGAGIPAGDKSPKWQEDGSWLHVSSWFPDSSFTLPPPPMPSSHDGRGLKRPDVAGGGLWAVLAPCGQALNTRLSVRSVLDDEGSNLRQQKLDRQVSEAGAGRKGGQRWLSQPESGPGGGLSSFLG